MTEEINLEYVKKLEQENQMLKEMKKSVNQISNDINRLLGFEPMAPGSVWFRNMAREDLVKLKNAIERLKNEKSNS